MFTRIRCPAVTAAITGLLCWCCCLPHAKHKHKMHLLLSPMTEVLPVLPASALLTSSSFAQLQIVASGPPPGADLVAVATQIYTPDAVLVVTPIAAFGDGLVAFEYLLTFSRAPAPYVPPPAATLTGFELHDMIASGSTVTAVFDLLLTSNFNASKTARMRGWSMAAFNKLSKITTQTIMYPLWEDAMQSLGIPESLTNVNVVAHVANQVCTAHQQFCSGTNQQYQDKAACMAFLLSLPPPPMHRLAGNNLFCRHFHARYVDISPAVHCPHIGPTGGHKCTEDLPYSMDKIATLIPKRPTFYSVNPLLQAAINQTAKW